MKRLHNLAEKRNIRWEGDTDFGSDWVSVPKEYMGGNADSHKTTLAYITDKERDHLKKKDMHGTGIDKEDHYGPSDVVSYDGTGGQNTGGGGDSSGHSGPDRSRSKSGYGRSKSSDNSKGSTYGSVDPSERGRFSAPDTVGRGDRAKDIVTTRVDRVKDFFSNAWDNVKDYANDPFGDGILGELAEVAFNVDDPGLDNLANMFGKNKATSTPTSDSTSTSNPFTDEAYDRVENNNRPDNRGGEGGGNNQQGVASTIRNITNPTQSMTSTPPSEEEEDDGFFPVINLITNKYRRLATLKHKRETRNG